MTLRLSALRTIGRNCIGFFGRCVRVGWLAIALIAIFVLQNHIFNILLGIAPSHASGAVKIAISDKLAYHAADDGVFERGTCLALSSKKRIAADACRSLYDKEETAVRASDAMVRSNLITQ